MRNLKIISAGLILVLAVIACGLPAPVPTPTVTPLPPTVTSPPTATVPVLPVFPSPNITSIDMLDTNNGWAISQTAALRTTDGGNTWKNVTPEGLSDLGYSADYFFLNAATGWIALMGTDPTNGTLYHTNDGGISWTSTAVPFGGGSLYFVDPMIGWDLTGLGAGMSHEAVAVFTTSDGGNTWTRVFTDDPTLPGSSDSLPFVGDKTGISAVDTSHAWVTGAEPVTNFIYIYATQDGGQDWAQQDVPVPAGFTDAMTNAIPPVFFGGNEGVLPVTLIGNTNAIAFYLSHDGGQTWAASQLVPQGGFTSVASQSDFFVWDGGTTLYASHDAGTSWSTVSPNVDLHDTLVSFQFVDATSGWALTSDVSGHHSLYETTDVGVTWNVLIP